MNKKTKKISYKAGQKSKKLTEFEEEKKDENRN